MADTKKPADDAPTSEGYYGGGFSAILESKTRGKRPGDLPPDQRKRVMTKEEMNRKPGLDDETLAEMKKYDEAIAAQKAKQSPESPNDAAAPAPKAGTKAGQRS